MGPQKVDSVLQLIGNTPLVRINRMNPVPGVELLAKLEMRNPGGSVKDRIALRMIQQAEADRRTDPRQDRPGGQQRQHGHRPGHGLRGQGLPAPGHHERVGQRGAQTHPPRLRGARSCSPPATAAPTARSKKPIASPAKNPSKYVLVDQFNNDANWQAHYEGTGREIWEATGGKVNVVVLTMGTTGTLMGITRVLRELDPAIRVVGVEPFKGHKIQGLKNMKESYPPGIFKPEELSAIVSVDDDSAYETARRLAREEGIFVGMSAGAAMKVAIDEARVLGQGAVVALLPDGGERYLSTSLFVSETVPEPLRFYNTLSAPRGATGAGVAGQGDDLFLRAEPGRAARPGALPPPGLRRRVAALSRVPRLPGQARHEPRRHRRPDREGMPQGGREMEGVHRPLGTASSSRPSIRFASAARTTIPGPASTSPTWWTRPAACWKKDWPTRNSARSTSASTARPTTASFPGSSCGRCGPTPRRPTITTRRTTAAISPCSSVPRWRS